MTCQRRENKGVLDSQINLAAASGIHRRVPEDVAGYLPWLPQVVGFEGLR